MASSGSNPLAVTSSKHSICEDEGERGIRSKRSRSKASDLHKSSRSTSRNEDTVAVCLSEEEQQQIQRYALTDVWSNDPETVVNAFEYLGHFVFSEDEYDRQNGKKRTDYIVQLGGILSVLKAMKRHSTEKMVQAEGCRLLGNIADHSFVASLVMARLGAIQAGLAAMKAHADSAEVQEDALSLLGHVLFNKENRDFIERYSEQIITEVLSAMSTFKLNPQVARWGCMALRNSVKWGSDAFIAKLLEENGDRIVWQSQLRYPNDQCLQEDAKVTLEFFLDYEDGGPGEYETWDSGNTSTAYRMATKAFSSQQGINTMVSALTQQIWTDDPHVVKNALHELSELLYEDEMEPTGQAVARVEVMSLAGGHLASVKALENHIALEDVQVLGLRILANIACDNANASSATAIMGGIEVAVAAMKRFDTSFDLQAAGCALLSHIAAANHPSANRIMDHKEGVEVILSAMASFSESSILQHFVSVALKYLCSGASRANKDRIIAAGGLRQLADVATRFRNEAFASNCHEAIAMLVQPPPT